MQRVIFSSKKSAYFLSGPVPALLTLIVHYFFESSLTQKYNFCIDLNNDQRISGQCFHFIPPENTRKSKVFWCFHEVKK